jgi:septal ring factor EnvC (AmiA/AmiB activator)
MTGISTEEKINTAVKTALSSRPRQDMFKWISLFLTVLSFSVCTVVWAYNQTDEIKDWTFQQNSVTKQEVQQTLDKHYVQKSEFTRVEQKLNDQKETMQEIKTKLDRLIEMNNRSRNAR